MTEDVPSPITGLQSCLVMTVYPTRFYINSSKVCIHKDVCSVARDSAHNPASHQSLVLSTPTQTQSLLWSARASSPPVSQMR